MIDSPAEDRRDESRRALQWRQLFQCCRLSLHVPQILLAAAGIVILATGQWAFTYLPFAPADLGVATCPVSRVLEVDSLAVDEVTLAATMSGSFHMLSLPIQSVYVPAKSLLGLQNDWMSTAWSITQLVWALCVWSIFGGAIARMTAVQFAAEQSVGMRAALRFSLQKFLSFFTSPLVPGGGFLLLWLLAVVGGWIGAIPSGGPVIIGVLWILGMLGAFVMALIVIGLVGGWPLMYATIAAEGSDAFDGFSRSFSYVFSRPLQWLRLTLTSLVIGVSATAAGLCLAMLVVYLTAWSVSTSMGTEGVAALMANSPFPLPKGLQPATDAAVETSATSLAVYWLQALAVIVRGFAVSLFWSLAVVSYFVLRLDDDATPFDEVYLVEEDEEDPLLPLVGVAASEQPVVERPVTKSLDANVEANEQSTDASDKTPPG